MPTPDSTQGALDAPPRDADLVRRVAERDESAMGELYDRFAPSLLAICGRILGRGAEADDVVQEVFLQVWRQAARYDSGRSSVAGWLALIARSRAIDRLRSRRVAERTADQANAENPRLHASSEGPRNVLFAERRARIADALGALPGEQREVIELAFFAGLTQSEIALRTGTPLGTVKTRTLLAMKKLRAALESELAELV
jgi:RNA polymerase sigma-70 factor (ECF subfamily)